ncbi:MAG TPA: L-aspartate oxidase [Acidimicrobiia bacterium]|nr:L-aspartate oxidase [Acidimicrobiia bacterium]
MIDLLVLGSGIAGLTSAVRAARAGMSVVVVTKGELSHSATRYAQGGVAAALADPDSPELHLADTISAGAGLCDVDAARVLVTEGPARVLELATMGAVFDTDADGTSWLLAREGGHSLARVVHAGGDATGAEIERALVAATHATAAAVREGWFASALVIDDGRCAGIRATDPAGEVHEIRAAHTVLSTGGAGQCFAVTTNPELSTGDGIALALRAGVACADVEFVQFHPTALHHPAMPRPLLSEALRGEGAVLRDADGVAFMEGEHPLADLAPRDVVSRCIATRLRDTGASHVWLDATSIAEFARRFPTIWSACRAVGLDPTRDWLPVAPAAHYLSGGVVTDLDGATTLPHLWASGEVACSGVHGANRLASNSLLDGLVFGGRVVDAIAAGRTGALETGAMRRIRDLPTTASAPRIAAASSDLTPDATRLRSDLQLAMTSDCGVLRDPIGLARAARVVADTTRRSAAATDIAGQEVDNLATVAAAIVSAALAREETRGSHARADHPHTSDAFAGRFVHVGGTEPVFVPLPASERVAT